MTALDLSSLKGKSVIKALLVVTGVFCVISATMAQLLKTNFANFYECNIPPLESLRVSLQGVLGYGITQVLYVLIVSALTAAFVLLSYAVYRLLQKLILSKQTVKI